LATLFPANKKRVFHVKKETTQRERERERKREREHT